MGVNHRSQYYESIDCNLIHKSRFSSYVNKTYKQTWTKE